MDVRVRATREVDLFNQPIVDPQPAASARRLAWEHVRATLTQRQQQVLELLVEHGPQAMHEIATLLGVPDHYVSGRFTELSDAGLIERTGERRRKPGSCRQVDVWRLIDRT